MRFYHAAGLGLLFLSLGVAWGGARIPTAREMPKYLNMTKSPVAKDRAMAFEMIGRRGAVSFDEVQPAIEPLKQAVQKDPDPNARRAAALALGSIKPEPKETVPVLLEALKSDKSMDVKVASAEALGFFGPDAKEAVAPIRELMNKFDPKKDREVRKNLQAAIGNITMAKKK